LDWVVAAAAVEAVVELEGPEAEPVYPALLGPQVERLRQQPPAPAAQERLVQQAAD
jgi:hypothetical protein